MVAVVGFEPTTFGLGARQRARRSTTSYRAPLALRTFTRLPAPLLRAFTRGRPLPLAPKARPTNERRLRAAQRAEGDIGVREPVRCGHLSKDHSGPAHRRRADKVGAACRGHDLARKNLGSHVRPVRRLVGLALALGLFGARLGPPDEDNRLARGANLDAAPKRPDTRDRWYVRRHGHVVVPPNLQCRRAIEGKSKFVWNKEQL